MVGIVELSEAIDAIDNAIGEDVLDDKNVLCRLQSKIEYRQNAIDDQLMEDDEDEDE